MSMILTKNNACFRIKLELTRERGIMCDANRNYKSSVFTDLFGEPNKELELYNAFSPEQYPPDTPVIDLTLKNVLFMGKYNDLSFSVGEKLVVFFEHQASINENMALRCLLYCGRVYEKLIKNSLMYATKRVTIPTPEFYVLYNGPKPFPDTMVYRLSDSFAQSSSDEPALELVVKVYNVNIGYNEEIVKRSEHLHGYITLVSKAREHELSGLERSKAVALAIKECIELGILVEYLTNNASEVLNMLFQEWNWEDAKTVWQKEAKEEGVELGEARSDQKWKSIIAEKDAQIAELLAQLKNR